MNWVQADQDEPLPVAVLQGARSALSDLPDLPVMQAPQGWGNMWGYICCSFPELNPALFRHGMLGGGRRQAALRLVQQIAQGTLACNPLRLMGFVKQTTLCQSTPQTLGKIRYFSGCAGEQRSSLGNACTLCTGGFGLRRLFQQSAKKACSFAQGNLGFCTGTCGSGCNIGQIACQDECQARFPVTKPVPGYRRAGYSGADSCPASCRRPVPQNGHWGDWRRHGRGLSVPA